VNGLKKPKRLKNDDYVSPDADDGTIVENLNSFNDALVGRRVVAVERSKSSGRIYHSGSVTAFTLDDGSRVELSDTDDCCAYTQMEGIIEKLPDITHAITGVVSSDGYQNWHIMADFGEIMELKVGWSSGNPFYYGYGFDINVRSISD